MEQRIKTLNWFKESYPKRVRQLREEKSRGKKVVGTFCLFVPDEIIFAAGADRLILCGGRSSTLQVAEEYLPRNICPLIKSSFGAIVDSSHNGNLACSHFHSIDAVVAEATCDGKKKMYELLQDIVPTYVLDLPQKPDSLQAKDFFVSELKRFGEFLEDLTGVKITNDALRKEILLANDTRISLHCLFDLRRRDPTPILGSDVISVLQKQFFLRPDEFRNGIEELCKGLEEADTTSFRRGPRIMISGCPMAAGNTKVPDIIEAKGGSIVVEESCTGTRSFWDLVDETKEPWAALGERYLKIPCACMTPNEDRIDRILELAEMFDVDGVVYYTLQSCHGYNIERYRVEKALREAKVPMLSIESDYSDSDIEQIGIRVEAFIEMLS